jgi:hypothetical protein
MRNWFVNVLTGLNRTVPILYGLQGAGKGVVVAQFARHVLGEDYYHESNDIGSLINGSFNSILSDRILVLIDEVPAAHGEFHAMFDKFKNWITGDYFTLKKKYIDDQSISNRFNFVLCTNNERAVKLEHGQRRFYMTEVSSSRKGDLAYFRDYCQWMSENGDILYTWLLQYDVSEYDFGQIPETEIMLQTIATFRNPFDAMVEEIITRGSFRDDEDEVCREMSLEQVMNMYSQMLSDRSMRNTYSLDVFSKMLRRKGFEVIRQQRNGKREQIVILSNI